MTITARIPKNAFRMTHVTKDLCHPVSNRGVGCQDHLKNILQALETAKANDKMIRSRYENGLVVKSDLLRARLRLSLSHIALPRNSESLWPWMML